MESQTIEELQLRLDQEKVRSDLLHTQMEYLDSVMQRAFVAFRDFSDILNQPHYMTLEERNLFKNKGLEAYYVYMKEEIAKIDLDAAKKYSFPLPK
jgi:hypothetical protein